jgi:anionic cell wall polymer biosynthesis LytR-Cps2A-Psr (LCP) family protein
MDGQTAVKYMRSRHANELEQQGDQARMRRQKQVIQSVVQHLYQPEILGDPVVLGRLYDWYADNFMAKIPLYDLGWLGGSIAQKSLPEMQTVTLPITEYAAATDEATLFVHPPDAKYRQWAYESVDPTWQKLHQFIIQNGL